MQPAEIIDLIAEQGSTFDQPFTVLGDNGLAVDLSTYGIRGEIRKKYTDADPALTFRIDETNITAGQFNAHLTAAQMASIAKGNYVYDIEIFYDTADVVPEEIVYKVVKGAFSVSPEVTKP